MKIHKLCNKNVYLVDGEDYMVYKKLFSSYLTNNRTYHFLSNKNLDELTKREYLVSLNTSGHKYLLTIYNNKHILYHKKGEEIYIVKLGYNFMENHIFECDMVRGKSEWILIICDVLDIKTNLIDRIEYMKSISNTFNIKSDLCRVELLEYFTTEYIADLASKYRLQVGFMSSGISFKEIDGQHRYIYIFESHRKEKPNKSYTKRILSAVKDVAILAMMKGNMPDTYELYYNDNGYLEYHSMACIRNAIHSMEIRDMFSDNDGEYKKMECSYSKEFEKWMPLRECNDKPIDNLEHITTLMSS